MNVKPVFHGNTSQINKPTVKTASKKAAEPKDGFQKNQPEEKMDTDRFRGLKDFLCNPPDVNAGGLFGGISIMVAGITAANAVGGSGMIPLMAASIIAGTAVLFSR